ncbi:MAG: hypothetical protein ACXAEU_22565 [Candidatus Hodarchaeales archaeon]
MTTIDAALARAFITEPAFRTDLWTYPSPTCLLDFGWFWNLFGWGFFGFIS